ncbi:MAG: MOSC domain-containing protein [Chloroflexi bacterium]|nr:MOSC domain-containing protein [Chloroflexota bacterium]MBI3734649.1 MOSC domain-containing protein [Chloroflexota bacterium]
MADGMGHIFQINASNGGVPKRAVREADVTALGLTGDAVEHPKIHGGPERALCLFALERIVALQAEGHPIFPGSVGENITVAGVDWARVVPGAQLRLGDRVLIEVTRYTTPCATIAGSFADGNSNRILQTEHEGWARVYARVLETGRIRVGERVRLM